MMQTHRQLNPIGDEAASSPAWIRRGKFCALGVLALSVSSLGAPVSAQFPPCPPPAANEYLLLVRSDTEAERTRVQDLLPSNSTVMVCDYLEDTVVRAGGFTNLENANAWAQYMTEVEGFQAFVARPAAASAQSVTDPATTSPITDPTATDPAVTDPTVTDPTTDPAVTDPAATVPPETDPAVPPDTAAATEPQAAQPTSSSSVTFVPQPLGEGFAVLVNYRYDPETAVAIQEQVGQAVGLAVHKQRSYLLIAYSSDIEGAATTLNVLSGYGISGFIVDSREVVMLTPAIALGN